MQFDLWSLLTFAGTTGIITTVLTAGLGWLTAVLRSKSSGSHLALQIAVSLDGFFMACGERYARLETESLNAGSALAIPEAPIFPPDTEAWRSLKRTLRSRAMGFANEVESGKQYVAFMDDAAPDPSGSDLRLQIAYFAVGAYELAYDLRKAYGWEPPKSWGMASTLCALRLIG